MQMKYYGRQILMQALQPQDACRVLDFYSRNRMHFNPWEPDRPQNFYTEAYHRTMLTKEISMFLNNTAYRFYLFPKRCPDQIAGCVALSNIKYGSFQSANIAYKTDCAYTRQGIMKEALDILIQLAFDEVRLHRLVAYIHPDNLPSIRIVEAFGFRKEGVAHDFIQKNGIWEDHLVYAKCQ